MLKQHLFGLAGFVVLSILLASCGGESAASSETIEETGVPSIIEASSNSNTLPDLIPINGQEVQEQVQASDGKAVLINVWATWCAPCIKKFPSVMKIRDEFSDKGLDTMFISADFEETTEKAREFLRDQGVDFPTFLKTGKDHEFIESFQSDWNGALPVMFLYDSNGKLIHTWGESVEPEEVELAIETLLSAQ